MDMMHQFRIHQHERRMLVRNRRHTADDKAALFAHEVGIGLADFFVDQCHYLFIIYPILAAGDHQHRTFAGTEDDRLGDFGNCATEGLRSGLCGMGRLIHDDDRIRQPGLAQGLLDAQHRRMGLDDFVRLVGHFQKLTWVKIEFYLTPIMVQAGGEVPYFAPMPIFKNNCFVMEDSNA